MWRLELGLSRIEFRTSRDLVDLRGRRWRARIAIAPVDRAQVSPSRRPIHPRS